MELLVTTKSKAVAVHVTPDEYARAQRAAKAVDLSVSELVREALRYLSDAILEKEPTSSG